MTSVSPPLPPLDVSPGPSVAEPLPADRPVRWGILATGKIANGFAKDLALLPDAEIAAVGARRLDSAKAFAARHGAAAAYGSYQELVADPDVDVVYVASPHALHKEHVLLAFEAGKPVLCEKAITLNARDAQELVDEARARGLFLMEAMWMRCNPTIRRLQQLFATGELGEIRQVRADLGFVVDKPGTDRLLDPALGGGALLDMGVYPLTFAHLFLGTPSRVAAAAYLSPAGVDLNLALSLGYDGSAIASLTSTMTAWSPRTASIATDRGRVDLPDAFHHPTTVTWTRFDSDPDFASGSPVQQIHEDVIGTGLANEALEVVRCLRNGEIESPLVPLDDTVALMRLMDQVREQIGVRYPGD
ncbi:MAG: Gfo/Idh/MocA family protein [Nocardioidaceae bacterium]